jgi:hypothetical protein
VSYAHCATFICKSLKMAELFKFKSYQGEPEQTIMKCLMKIIFLSISPHHKKEAFLNAVSKIVDEFIYAFEL